jgi:hypothetical protein
MFPYSMCVENAEMLIEFGLLNSDLNFPHNQLLQDINNEVPKSQDGG